jgi:hypothetical protein
LNNKGPSSLNGPTAALLAKKQHTRLQTGRGNIPIASQVPVNLHQLQKQHVLPPLQGTVTALSGASEGVCGEKEKTIPPNKILQMRDIQKYGKITKDGKTVCVAKTNWDKLESCFRQLKDDRIKLSSDNNKLKEENKQLRAAHATTEENLQKALAYKAEALDYASTTTLKVRGKPKKLVAGLKSDLNLDVQAAIKEHVKLVLFRTIKFAQPGPQLDAVVAMVWEAIKDTKQLEKGTKPMTLEQFGLVYGGVILTELSGRRQYHQTRCRNAAYGT